MEITNVCNLMELNKFLADGKRIFKMSDELYHSPDCPGLTRSKLKEFAIAPANYVASLYLSKKDSPAMAFGRHFHTALLEPENWKKLAIVEPEFKGVKGNTIASQRKAFQLEKPDNIIVDKDDFDLINKLSKVFHESKTKKRLFENWKSTFREVCFFHSMANENFLKVKPDILLLSEVNRPIIFDIKTSAKGGGSLDGFSYRIRDTREGLYTQAALYPLVVQSALGLDERPRFIFINIEKEPPYLISDFEMTDIYIDWALEKVTNQLDDFVFCKKNDNWPGYPDQTQIIEMPKYLKW